MKIRLDYITNSSSSSYTCIVCGDTECGMDMSLSDAGMVRCQNGHVFCEDHALPDTKKETDNKSILRKYIEEEINYCKDNLDRNQNYYQKRIDQLVSELSEVDNLNENEVEDKLYYWEDDDGAYNFPIARCPICNFKNIPEENIASYLMKKYNINYEALKKEMVNTFNNYNEFLNYVKK